MDSKRKWTAAQRAAAEASIAEICHYAVPIRGGEADRRRALAADLEAALLVDLDIEGATLSLAQGESK